MDIKLELSESPICFIWMIWSYTKKKKKNCERLLRIVKEFSDDIGMEFGLSKYAKATFKRGKLEKFDNVRLDEETILKDLEQEKV